MKKEFFGKTKLGKEIYAHTISNGEIGITVLDYGATLQKFTHKGVDIVCGYDTLDGYIASDGYVGATVGRYANRIGGGRLTIDGRMYPIANNNGQAHLHGGNVGFDKHTWNVEEGVCPDGSPALSCGFVSADGEEGYPGRLIVTVTYILRGGDLIIEYRAKTNKPTYCNLTNHSYFNLHGFANGLILDHKLTVHADYYTAADPETLLPTGDRPGVAGTAFDFRSEKEIGLDFDKTGLPYPGYDHNFILTGKEAETYKGLALRVAATCRVPEREMTVLTSMPCMQMYTANFLGDGADFKGGVSQKKHQAVCFETQYEPDSPSRGEARLDPDKEYFHVTVYRLK